MEIDLGELEQFEQQLAKKRNNAEVMGSTTHRSKPDTAVDDLDEYLDRLAIDIKNKDANHVNRVSCDKSNQIVTNLTSNDDTNSVKMMRAEPSTQSAIPNPIVHTSLPLLLFGFFSILFFIDTVNRNQQFRCKQYKYSYTNNGIQ